MDERRKVQLKEKTSSMNKSDAKTEINQRVQNTRKDIEHLKAELEELISAGIKTPAYSNNVIGDKENNQVPIIKSYDIAPVPSSYVKKDKTKKSPQTNESIPKKVKNYNIEETREYMKRQKEKRLEQVKHQTVENVNTKDLKKQKLEELHKKSLEIVARSVRIKRERSKSREKGGEETTRQRSASRERKTLSFGSSHDTQAGLKNRSKSCEILDKEQQGTKTSFLQVPKEPLNDECGKSKRNSRRQGLETKNLDKANRNNEPKTKTSFLQVPNNDEWKTRRESQRQGLETKDLEKENINVNISGKTVSTVSETKDSQHIPSIEPTNSKGLIKHLPKSSALKNVTVRTSDDRLAPPLVDNLELFSARKSKSTSRSQSCSSGKAKQKLNFDNLEETQPSITKFPDWLQDKPVQSFPHNFINTVKRKLLFEVNSPQPKSVFLDKGIQSSLRDPTNRSITPENNPKTKKEIIDLIQKSTKSSKNSHSNLKSFMSHKCLNLDSKSIDHLELKSNDVKKSPSRKTIVSDMESASDTSKNIPDISIESVTSLRRNAESAKQQIEDLQINTDRLKSMRLKQRDSRKSDGKMSENSGDSVGKEDTKSPSIQSSITEEISSSQRSKETVQSKSDKSKLTKSYSSDFDDTFNKASASSRDSIISHNCCKYDRSHSSTRSHLSTRNTEKPPSIISEVRSVSEENIPEKNDLSQKKLLEVNKSSSMATINIPTESQTQIGSTVRSSISNIPKSSEKVHSQSKSASESSESNKSFIKLKEAIPLKEPKISLRLEKFGRSNENLRNADNNFEGSVNMNNTNEIHLKFEAEIHLLNDFNESLRQLSAVEKAFKSIQNNTNVPNGNCGLNKDTQTSILTKSPPSAKFSDNAVVSDGNKSLVSTINYSRGSEIDDNNTNFLLDNSIVKSGSLMGSVFDISEGNLSISSMNIMEFSDCDNFGGGTNKFAGLSLKMFEQLIKDEDLRLENLKTILKIREQALLDRTKSELAYLEIQRKHLKETGKLHEASLIKKKQRGILLKHQQEKHEMQRLKQMQKAATNERKIILKEQRKLIKAQLSTESMLSKIKVNTPRERRQIGPMRVIQNRSSETSFSRKSSASEEVLSVTSQSQSIIMSRVSDIDDQLDHSRNARVLHEVPIANMKRTLLMREAALQKRRKAAEELLQWHRKLLDEEKRIVELEHTANKVISQRPTAPSDTPTEKHKFTGKQLNQLWQNLTESHEKKFEDKKMYPMSQMSLERFCKSAKEYSSKAKKLLSKTDSLSDVNNIETDHSDLSDILNQNIPQKQPGSQSSGARTHTETSKKIKSIVNNYTSDFDIDSVSNNDMDDVDLEHKKISSINELIDNFSKIQDEISLISKSSKKSLEHAEDSDSKSDKNSLEQVTSVIETEKPSQKPVEDSFEIKTEDTGLAPDLTTQRESDEPMVVVSEVDESLKESKVSEELPTDTPSESKTLFCSTPFIQEHSPEVAEEIEVQEQKSSIDDEDELKLSTEGTRSVDEMQSEKFSDDTPKEELKIIDDPVEVTEDSVKSADDINLTVDDFKSTSEVATDILKQVEETLSVPSTETDDYNEGFDPETDKDKTSTISIESKSTESQSANKEVHSLEEKEHDSLSSSSSSQLAKSEIETMQVSEKSSATEQSVPTEKISEEKLESEERTVSVEKSLSPEKSGSISEDSSKTGTVNVKKRVSEIMADASQPSRGDKSPRFQDLCATVPYDVESPTNSPESGSPQQESPKHSPKNIFGTEAEELLKKQLAVEKEIKRLEQQQKEQLPYLYMREIPNKPPPPYTPPSSLALTNIKTVLPTKGEEIDEVTKYSAKILYKAYLSNNLENISVSEKTMNLITKNVGTECYKFVFDLCKEIAKEHYKQFEKDTGPSWLIVSKQPQLASTKPLDAEELEKYMNKKLKELFGFKKTEIRENAIIKWSRKKRDHVDEILVLESQTEEAEWMNYDKDERFVMNNITNEIMNSLLAETAHVFNAILSKKK